MNKISVDRSTISYFYRRYRDYIVPIATLIVSFLLLLKITIPTLNNLSTKEQEIKFEKEKLATLQNNLQILTHLNDQTLSNQLSVVTNALPSEKNFAEILNAVSISANKSGVFLGDYEFQVGDLSKTVTPLKGLPSLSLSLVVNGNANATAKFVTELYRSFPVSEVTDIEVNGNRAALSAVFYYKPFNQAKIDETIKLSNLTTPDLNTIRNISSWNNPRVLEEITPILTPSTVSTASAL